MGSPVATTDGNKCLGWKWPLWNAPVWILGVWDFCFHQTSTQAVAQSAFPGLARGICGQIPETEGLES